MMFLVGSTPRGRSREGLCIDPPGHLKMFHMFHDHPSGDDKEMILQHPGWGEFSKILVFSLKCWSPLRSPIEGCHIS